MQFYVKYGDVQDGPFDLVTMIRKIRNKELSQDVLVMEANDSHAVAARQHPKLQSFFEELENGNLKNDMMPSSDRGVAGLLRNALLLFQHNPNLAIYSSWVIFITLLFGLLVGMLASDTIAIFMSWWCFNFLNGAMLLVAKQVESGDSISVKSIIVKYMANLRAILAYSVMISLLSVVGGLFLLIPGLIVITLTIFAPLLILEEGYGCWQAMQASKNYLLRHDRKMAEMVFILVAVNFVAGAAFLLPLAMVMPITYAAIIEIYQKLAIQR